jgi:hypothetical protein
LSTFGSTADITLRQAIEPSKMHPVNESLQNKTSMTAVARASNEPVDAGLDRWRQESVMLLDTCKVLHQENARLRHALNNERFEQHRLRNSVMDLREQISEQSRDLEKTCWTIAELRQGEEEKTLLREQIAGHIRELEKSSCLIADLCGCHEQNLLLKEQIVSRANELEQSSVIIADLRRAAETNGLLQEQLASRTSELEQSFLTIAELRRSEAETISLKQQIAAHNRELAQLNSTISDLRRLEDVEARCQEILASTSWKVTKPLRFIGRLLRSVWRNP